MRTIYTNVLRCIMIMDQIEVLTAQFFTGVLQSVMDFMAQLT